VFTQLRCCEKRRLDVPFPYLHENGGICCSSLDAPCLDCRLKLKAEGQLTDAQRAFGFRLDGWYGPLMRWIKKAKSRPEDQQMSQRNELAEYVPPCPYAAGLEALRAASRREIPFAERYRAERLAALEAEQSEASDRPTLSTLSQEEMEGFAPPDPYEAGLKALRSQAS
jgi:hypothetical protein